MIARIEIKPRKVTATTKQELIEKIRGLSFRYCLYNGTNGAYYDYDKRQYHLYNANKIRRKTKQIKRVIKSGVNKGNVATKTEVIRHGHWEAFVYAIPMSMVSNVKQNSRNFTVEFKKNW